jgi:hypothetical protein
MFGSQGGIGDIVSAIVLTRLADKQASSSLNPFPPSPTTRKICMKPLALVDPLLPFGFGKEQ